MGAGRSIEEQYIKTGKANFTYKYYPILDRGNVDGESHWSAYAAECANRQGRFWEYHDKLFSAWQGENVGAFTKANLKKFAADLKLDASAFNTCLDGDQTKAIVEADVAVGRKLNVGGTPTFFVNGQLIQPGLTFDAFVPYLQVQR